METVAENAVTHQLGIPASPVWRPGVPASRVHLNLVAAMPYKIISAFRVYSVIFNFLRPHYGVFAKNDVSSPAGKRRAARCLRQGL